MEPRIGNEVSPVLWTFFFPLMAVVTLCDGLHILFNPFSLIVFINESEIIRTVLKKYFILFEVHAFLRVVELRQSFGGLSLSFK